MLLSRKRLRETTESPLLRGPEELLAFKSSSATRHDMTDGKRLLRDLVGSAGASPVRNGSRDALLELLARLQERDTHHAAAAVPSTHEMSRAHLNSQELFLSVVLEWQRSTETVHLSEPMESPTAAVFRHDRSFRSATNEVNYASSASSYTSSDDEQDELPKTKRSSHQGEEVSPTSVHNVPVGALTPLRLSDVGSSMKRIGIYTPRARQELLRKYMAKRARRLSQHKVRYGVRKTLANARPRVKGRFVKTETPLTAALVQQGQPSSEH